MAKWLAKSPVTREAIEAETPSIGAYFPALTKFYVDDLKMRVILVLEEDEAKALKEAIVKSHGQFKPEYLQGVVHEALAEWLTKRS